ncbi:ribonuclease M5 [Geobacillus sp. FSL K6-0789]|jgi:ribonuclease M5|uniref:Ribonuclease M5 n=1 Tax=Geobacillus stearothermophilus TaxID=1422 RepID=A0A087LGV4_GEOSE|nr:MULTISPECIES: ribonuclease M5 [Geobacillus]AKU26782.1 ribonuclease M5 [Geobacillus sp. LC300]ASS87455.1 ribonuclease M5 [Geobacillus lituanicus]MED0652597.1 ribonuclease M5 [Anoxybacillus geothermalis]KAF6511301.1 Ribonuclease M5 [Geobacillus stearothermophilus]KFL16857.1 ribonuclease M5 [Geobacillus stearothermophilus]
MKIKEVIVVEGKDDTAAIRRAVDADTIETNGAAVGAEVIERIKLAKERRGVIIFTDPDFPGEKIRRTIAEQVPGCKHAFLPREAAKARSGKGIGVEHASPDDIRQALANVYEETADWEEEITFAELIEAGLVGGEMARRRRQRLGEELKIGYANGRQFHKRLKVFRISRDAFYAALAQVMREEAGDA